MLQRTIYETSLTFETEAEVRAFMMGIEMENELREHFSASIDREEPNAVNINLWDREVPSSRSTLSDYMDIVRLWKGPSNANRNNRNGR